MSSAVDWSKQHCGVHQAPFTAALELMPDLTDLLLSFPENDPREYTWDIKVHMLMPRQYPCIPGWHVDNVPRPLGPQEFDKTLTDAPMWMWVSGPPLTQFRNGYVLANRWFRFTQADEHRGQPAADFGWRGFIRATHASIQKPKPGPWLRRHSQVYVEENYQW